MKKLQDFYDEIYIFVGLFIWMPFMIIVDTIVDLWRKGKICFKCGEYDDLEGV